MAYNIVTLEDICEQLEGIQSTLENQELECSCPSEDDLESLLDRLFVNKATPPNVPVLFTNTLNNRHWTSPPFYTHPRGYKMELVISYRRAGNIAATPNNCYAKFILLDGEYDDYLRFPIRMTIELHVMKKTTNESRSITFCFDDNTPPEYTARIVGYSNHRNRAGYVLLLRGDEIDLYKIDGCLTFKITKVETSYI